MPLHELGGDVPIKSREILSIQPTHLEQVTISYWSRHLCLLREVLNPPSLEIFKTYLHVFPMYLASGDPALAGRLDWRISKCSAQPNYSMILWSDHLDSQLDCWLCWLDKRFISLHTLCHFWHCKFSHLASSFCSRPCGSPVRLLPHLPVLCRCLRNVGASQTSLEACV